MARAWVMGGLIEEIVYRGFLMSETATIVGKGGWESAVTLLIIALLFGTAH